MNRDDSGSKPTVWAACCKAKGPYNIILNRECYPFFTPKLRLS